MQAVGLIVNPIAGLGGRSGLKGSDSPELLEIARERGGIARGVERTQNALQHFGDLPQGFKWITGAGVLGADLLKDRDEPVMVLPVGRSDEQSTAKDTKKLARQMLESGVKIILFAGGDGTARDILDEVGSLVVVLGIPAGVKIHSPVYARSPTAAGTLARRYVTGQLKRTREVEVMDLDEQALRQDIVKTSLYGYMLVPDDYTLTQGAKARSRGCDAQYAEAIAAEVADNMDDETLYVLGPGTTTAKIKSELGLKGSLVGIDVIFNRKLLAKDVSEPELLALLDKNSRSQLLVTVIGGQGFILGRGNLQLSPAVLKHIGSKNVFVVATPHKIETQMGKPLLIDTGDYQLDLELSGYMPVITGYQNRIIYPVKPA